MWCFLTIAFSPTFSPQFALFFDKLIRDLAHKTMTDMLINHGAWPVRMCDVFVVAMMVAVFTVIVTVSVCMVVVMAVIVRVRMSVIM